MYLRDLPGKTLNQFGREIDDTSESSQVAGSEVALALLDPEPHISIGSVEVPATREGLESLGRFVNVPPTFLFPSQREVDPEEQQFVLQRRLARLGDTMSIRHTSEGVTGVYKSGQAPMNPRRLVDVARRVMPGSSQIIEYVADNSEVWFDVAMPFRNLATGDPAEGDLTAAGLSFAYNRARNLAPSVDEFMYRLACTNGMSLKDHALDSEFRVDARSAETIDDVMAALEARAREAFSRVEQQINAFYDLRNQAVVGDPADTLRRLGMEQGLPERTINDIISTTLPPAVEAGEAGTMFHLVNLITNEANNPRRAGRRTTRRALEGAGGTLIAEHAERCNYCHSRLN